MHDAESHYQTHAMDFLDYAYLQTGQEAKARALSEEEMRVPGSGEGERASHKAEVQARNALELHRWKEAAALPVPESHRSRDVIYWARAIGAARSGNLQAAKDSVQGLTTAVAHREGESQAAGDPVSGELATDLGEAQAWLAFAEGDSARAVKWMRAVADREDAKGVESTTMPAREMLADMLLELKRPGEALEAYRLVMQEAPNRFDDLLGAAQASQAAGDAHGAHNYYSQLAAVADPSADRPELKEMKANLPLPGN
jgi:hypothetical protein